MDIPQKKIFISRKRKPCEQIFQRLMVTYNGRVGMCCHDWGAQHGVGFVDKESFEKDQKEFRVQVFNSIDETPRKSNSKYFQLDEIIYSEYYSTMCTCY